MNVLCIIITALGRVVSAVKARDRLSAADRSTLSLNKTMGSALPSARFKM